MAIHTDIEPTQNEFYLYKDDIVVKLWNGVGKVSNYILNFWEELRQSNSSSVHLSWIQDLNNAINIFKEIIETVRYKIWPFNYDKIDKVLEIVNHTKESNNKSPFIHLNIRDLDGFHGEIFSWDGFDSDEIKYINFNLDFILDVIRKFKVNFLQKTDVAVRMSLLVKKITRKFNQYKINVKRDMDKLKLLIENPVDAARQINGNLNKILKSANETNMHQVVDEINSNLKRLGNVSAIISAGNQLESTLKRLHQAMEAYPVDFELILSNDPTMLYNKNDETSTLIHFYNVNEHIILFKGIDLKDSKSDNLWISKMVEFLEICTNF